MLRTADFVRAGLRTGMKGTASWTYSVGGERLAVAFTIDTVDPNFSSIRFSHDTRNSNPAVQSYHVRLRRTPQRFGGFRWWFECPKTGRRTIKLYLPLGGSRFLSRQGYGLGYASQREDRMYRAQRQALKVYRELEGEGNWRDGAPPKPKWMRWSTYERLSDRLDHYNACFDGSWLVSANAMIRRYR